MRPIQLLRRSLVPAVIVALASACAAEPTTPIVGKLGKGDDDVTQTKKDDKKKTPSKKEEPTDTPAPSSTPPPPSTPQVDQPPTLASIAPEAITIGTTTGPVDVVLTGTRFATTSQVDVAGTKLPTTVVSPEQIKVQIPADKLKLAGALRISVVAKPGLESNALSFTVANPTTVTIASLTPANVILTGAPADVSLNVTGSGFTQQSVVRFNGAALATTFTSGTQLRATIPGISFINAGRFSVTVSTGDNVISLPSPFEVRNPKPSTTSLSPASVTAGAGATVVTIAGSGFTKASEVASGTNALATTFVSATQLRVTVPSFLITKEGNVSLVVSTGAPGGGTSTALTLAVKAGQSTAQNACAYKCADYGYKPYTCYSNWYCIGSGTNAGCLAQITCTDTDIDVGNPNETNNTAACQYKCTDYYYAPGECSDGWYCRYSDGCLVEDSQCKAGAASGSSSSGSAANACKWKCSDYGYVKGECSFGYYCQYADGCLVENSSCAGSGTSSGSSGGSSGSSGGGCQYKCSDYNYQPGDCEGGYYCQYSDGCLVADSTCN